MDSGRRAIGPSVSGSERPESSAGAYNEVDPVNGHNSRQWERGFFGQHPVVDIRTWLIVGALSGIAALSAGVIGSTGNALYAIALAGLVVGGYLALQLRLLLWSAILGGLIVAGTIRLYFPALQQAQWLLAPISLILLGHVILVFMSRHNDIDPRPIPSIVWWSLAFILVTIVSSILNHIDSGRLIVGMKGYFQVWGLLFALAMIPWQQRTVDAIPKFLVLAALAQLPFVLHQFLVLVPKRAGMGDGTIAVDIVAGTFGANFEGGGANAILAAFMVTVIAGLIAAAQARIISWVWTIAVSILLFLPLLINMAKVSLLYVLAAFALLFWRDLGHHPARFIGATLALSLIAAILTAGFIMNAPDSSKVHDWRSLVQYTYDYSIAEEEIGGTMTRGAALRYWFEAHSPLATDLTSVLIGHGVGFTRVPDENNPTQMAATMLQDGVPSQVDLRSKPGVTTVSTLLWEIGVIGLVCVFGLFLSTYRAAGRLAADFTEHPERVAALRAAQVGVVIIGITLFHRNLFVFDVIYQTLIVVICGYVAFWDRNTGLQPTRRV
jgi:hypothetical protein